MSFDEILDLTAEVYFQLYNIYKYCFSPLLQCNAWCWYCYFRWRILSQIQHNIYFISLSLPVTVVSTILRHHMYGGWSLNLTLHGVVRRTEPAREPPKKKCPKQHNPRYRTIGVSNSYCTYIQQYSILQSSILSPCRDCGVKRVNLAVE